MFVLISYVQIFRAFSYNNDFLFSFILYMTKYYEGNVCSCKMYQYCLNIKNYFSFKKKIHTKPLKNVQKRLS